MAAVGAAVLCVPALRGPFNRFVNNANERLNSEYVVDNYKSEYVKMYGRKNQLVKNIQELTVQKKISEKKLENSRNNTETAKRKLISVGTSDMKAFSKARGTYETFKTETENLEIMVKTYEEALEKLEKSLSLVESNMYKAKLNIDTLTSKKVMLDSIKAVNSTLETINGTANTDLVINVEKLDDNLMRESIKLETIDNSTVVRVLTETEAKAYIENLK